MSLPPELIDRLKALDESTLPRAILIDLLAFALEMAHRAIDAAKEMSEFLNRLPPAPPK